MSPKSQIIQSDDMTSHSIIQDSRPDAPDPFRQNVTQRSTFQK